MKPILIVDDYGADTYDGIVDLEHWSNEGIVDFRKSLQQPDRLSSDDFAAVFIHASHPDLNWVIARLADLPSIEFTGGRISDSGLNGNTYYTTRDDFYTRIEGILERYAETGLISPEDLVPRCEKMKAHRGSTSDPEESPIDWTKVISFDLTVKTPNPSTLTYPVIRKGSKGIDFVETLRPLASIEEATPIYLQESYGENVTGLELLLRLRLGEALGGQFSRFPVFIRLASPEDTIKQARPAYIVALSKTAQYGSAFPDPQSFRDEGLISDGEMNAFLEEVPLRPDPGMDHHDLSNAWGAFRLWSGYRALSGASTSLEEMSLALRQLRNDLLRREYYMYLEARSSLHVVDEVAEVDLKAAGLLESWNRLISRGRKTDSPIRVLLIDDESEKGWEVVVSDMLGADDAPVEFQVFPEGDRFDFNDALNTSADQWDVILCDLRLSSWKDPRRTASSDPSQKELYSGVELLKKIKQQSPFTPVIAFTSSNNIWTIEAAYDAGAQHYWVKESPRRSKNVGYSVRSAAELLQAVIESVSRRRQWAFLENLLQRLTTALEDREYREVFAQLSTMNEVSDRLEAIRRLLCRAYGFCFRTPSRFRKEQLKYSEDDARNHAFLQLWGCLNEVVNLRFRNREGRRCKLIRADGSKKVYWGEFTSEGVEPWAEDYLRPDNEVDRLNIKPYKSPSERGSDWAYIAFLLREGGFPGLEEKLLRCKDLRNSLDIIHGHTTKQVESVDFNQHLRPLSEIVGRLLFL